MANIAGAGTYVAAITTLVAMWLAISLAFAIPVGVSASRRKMNPFGWSILVFFTWAVGLVIFLIFIKPKCDDVKCVSCGEMIPKNHIYCPFCGHSANL